MLLRCCKRTTRVYCRQSSSSRRVTSPLLSTRCLAPGGICQTVVSSQATLGRSLSSFSKAHGSGAARNSHNLSLLFITVGVIGCGALSFWHGPTTANDTPSTKEYFKTLEAEDPLPDWKGKVYPALDLDAANMKLRLEEETSTFTTKRSTNPTRVDSIRVPSNNPSEDEKSFDIFNVGETEDWRFWGVFDGHAGWATSAVLRKWLAGYVAQAIRRVNNTASPLNQETVGNAIKSGFLKLDDEITSDGINAMTDSQNHAEAVSRIAPAIAGSCALLAVYDPINAVLRVACTGDSRAVLGRRTASQSSDTSSQYTAEALSVDQTGFNEDELKRITDAHPDEPDVIEKSSGRLLGLAVTRAFGDHRFKWSEKDIKECQNNFYGFAPRPKYISPPYLTAEPEVTTTKVSSGDFLILASDGLWDHMSSKDAVKCVSQWVEKHKLNARSKEALISTPVFASTRDPNQKYNYDYKGTPEHFVVEDKNAATHLVKNALGGSRRELFCSVMSVQAPASRYVRDDITVQIVFFGDAFGK